MNYPIISPGQNVALASCHNPPPIASLAATPSCRHLVISSRIRHYVTKTVNTVQCYLRRTFNRNNFCIYWIICMVIHRFNKQLKPKLSFILSMLVRT